jgi:hypothetical protein
MIWNRFIDSSKNATFLFKREFLEYHKDRFQDYSLLFFKDEQLVGLLPANRVEDEIYSHQGLSYGGILLSSKSKFDDVFYVYYSLLKYLEEHNIKKFHLKLLPDIYTKLPSNEISYLLFKTEASLVRKDISSVIEYSHQLQIDSSNRKRGIKKGIKNDLIIKEESDLSTFWNEILIPNLKESHNVLPVHTASEINKLKNSFPNHIKQYSVFHKNKIVAGATIFETDTVAHVQYISANKDRQQLGSLDVLFNCLINEKYKHKKYFNFGISTENQGHYVNKGLLSWKESFGGRSIVHEFYEISTKNHVLLNDLFL